MWTLFDIPASEAVPIAEFGPFCKSGKTHVSDANNDNAAVFIMQCSHTKEFLRRCRWSRLRRGTVPAAPARLLLSPGHWAPGVWARGLYGAAGTLWNSPCVVVGMMVVVRVEVEVAELAVVEDAGGSPGFRHRGPLVSAAAPARSRPAWEPPRQNYACGGH